MRLSKIELNGFKSFAKRTELQFSNGITAVIGPNGSGKSNISDAVRWVLGEQSAKALRGSKMEDVIFNGTQTRRAQSFCEVTLTFDNSDGKLPIEFAEVGITRRVFRSGESEYCINGTSCRLKDILELFRDTGIGKDGYSIISQGKVDEILSNKTNDRRAALEEAAGVMRYRVRKEEAERKLEHTEKNMERIRDILKELGDRIDPLFKQSETARTFLRLRDELRDLEINMFLYQTDKYKERIVTLGQAVEQLSEEISVNEASDRNLQSEARVMEEKAHELDSLLSAQQNELLTLLSGAETHAGECKLLMERREHGKQEKRRIEGEIEQETEHYQRLEEGLRLVNEKHEDESKRVELDAKIAAQTAELESVDAALIDEENALESMKNAMMEAMNRIYDAKSDISRYDAMTAALNGRLETLDKSERILAAQRESLNEESERARAEYDKQKDDKNAAVSALSDAQQNRRELENEYQLKQNELRTQEQHCNAQESRLRVLREMIKAREGYQNSVKMLLQDAANDAKLKDSMVGVVAELISVPKEYETAIDITLGGSLQNIVTDTAEDAKILIEHLRKNEYGRATFLPLSMLTPTVLTSKEREYLNNSGVVGVASELISADKKMQPVVDYLLGKTVIVNNLDSGIALKKIAKNAFHIATLNGDFISVGGTMTGGGSHKRSFGILGREREVKELTEEVVAEQKKCAQTEKSIDEMKQRLMLADVQIDAFAREVNECNTRLAVFLEKLDIIERDRLSERTSEDRLNEEREEVRENLADIEKNKQKCLSIQTDLDNMNTASREDIIKAQQELSQKRVNREQKSIALTDLLVMQMAMRKESDARQAERERLEREAQGVSRHIESMKTDIAALDSADAQIDKTLGDMESALGGEQKRVEIAKDEQARLEKERNELYELIAQHRASRDVLSETYRALCDRKNKNELSLNRLDIELANMQNKIWEDYELTYDNAMAFRHDFAVGNTNARIAELRGEIRELGDVNVSSIEDYVTVSERYETLNTQFTDLSKAKDDLHTLIGQLTASMEEVFTTEFEKVQRNFGEVFSQLFGGGHAELRLADKNDVLGCDIDIIAQPPGKKLQLLSLLSGGERALTAIALLFAMLKLKAPAFCVLDEIETSLDEVNVSRFSEYLRDYSKDTQFIIITHRKGSMEVCDSLYGVAMEEKGISTIVSAKFEEAS